MSSDYLPPSQFPKIHDPAISRYQSVLLRGSVHILTGYWLKLLSHCSKIHCPDRPSGHCERVSTPFQAVLENPPSMRYFGVKVVKHSCFYRWPSPSPHLHLRNMQVHIGVTDQMGHRLLFRNCCSFKLKVCRVDVWVLKGLEIEEKIFNLKILECLLTCWSILMTFWRLGALTIILAVSFSWQAHQQMLMLPLDSSC